MSSLAESVQESNGVRVNDAATPLDTLDPENEQWDDEISQSTGLRDENAAVPLPGTLDPDNEQWDDESTGVRYENAAAPLPGTLDPEDEQWDDEISQSTGAREENAAVPLPGTLDPDNEQWDDEICDTVHAAVPLPGTLDPDNEQWDDEISQSTGAREENAAVPLQGTLDPDNEQWDDEISQSTGAREENAAVPLPGTLDPDNEQWDDEEPGVFPVDCMQMDEVIPVLQSAEAVPGAKLLIMVAQVYSPSHFWLQIDVTGRPMDLLMDEMKVYYNGVRFRALHRDAIRVGHYCAALYDGDWHRAVIVDIFDWNNIKIRYIDYGTVATVKELELKPLLRKYAALPAQALRARLAGVRPAGEATNWTSLAFNSFFDSVCERTLRAEISAVDTETGVLETFLIDTDGPEEVCLSAKLIGEGHADKRADSALRSKDLYLVPTFETLESSGTSPPDTPSDAAVTSPIATTSAAAVDHNPPVKSGG